MKTWPWRGLSRRARTVGATLLVAGASALPFACGDDPPELADAPDAAPDAFAEDVASPFDDAGTFADGTAAPQPCAKMDVLFVIDDSASMGEEQKEMAGRLGTVTRILDGFQAKGGALLDYRLAVTTTGRDIREHIDAGVPFPPTDYAGMNGKLRRVCTMTRPWLERGDPDLEANFACAINAGISGPPYEMPLEVTKLALDDRTKDGQNAGFFRDDAVLAVVVLTDEDDCSLHVDEVTLTLTGPNPCLDVDAGGLAVPVADYFPIFDALKGGRERWSFAAIAAPERCTSPLGDAEKATRLQQFVAGVGKNGVFGSICDGDVNKVLEAALTTFGVACKNVEVR